MANLEHFPSGKSKNLKEEPKSMKEIKKEIEEKLIDFASDIPDEYLEDVKYKSYLKRLKNQVEMMKNMGRSSENLG